jgi:hypothetical protein
MFIKLLPVFPIEGLGSPMLVVSRDRVQSFHMLDFDCVRQLIFDVKPNYSMSSIRRVPFGKNDTKCMCLKSLISKLIFDIAATLN